MIGTLLGRFTRRHGIYEPPLEPAVVESIAVRRIAPGEHDVAELGRTSLLVDAVTGSVDILLRFPTGPSYAARLGDDLARRLVPALELATDALLPLIEHDLNHSHTTTTRSNRVSDDSPHRRQARRRHRGRPEPD